jgi:hypothetical protein
MFNNVWTFKECCRFIINVTLAFCFMGVKKHVNFSLTLSLMAKVINNLVFLIIMCNKVLNSIKRRILVFLEQF